MFRFIMLVIALAAGFYFFHEAEVKQPDGVLVANAPTQRSTPEKSWKVGDSTITALALFGLEARVLGKEAYYMDRESKLSRYDLNLGWQKMSDNTVLNQLSISQSGRWWKWKTKNGYPIPHEEINSSAANMHMIPANDQVAATLAKIKKGNVVLLAGYLVRADDPDGSHWKSSVSRTDTGAGACELIWVEKLEILR